LSPILDLPPTSPPARGSLSLHDALPICPGKPQLPGVHDHHFVVVTLEHRRERPGAAAVPVPIRPGQAAQPRRRIESTHASDRTADRKSTRLNSSHVKISYAVFCLKKKIP